eukprot:7293567-Pyramimonas_sp.AAC.1
MASGMPPYSIRSSSAAEKTAPPSHGTEPPKTRCPPRQEPLKNRMRCSSACVPTLHLASDGLPRPKAGSRIPWNSRKQVSNNDSEGARARSNTVPNWL